MLNRRMSWPGYVNARTLAGIRVTGGVVAPAALFRAERAGLVRRYEAGPGTPEAEQRALVSALASSGVRTVIDLRRGVEGDELRWLEGHPGLRHVPIVDPAGHDVDSEATTQSGIYADILSQAGASFVEVCRTIVEAPEGGVLVHCTAGKDRTGLVCALVLGILGASTDDIADDYTLTRDNLARYHEQWLLTIVDEHERARIRAMDTNANRSTMVETVAWLAERGGAEAFLRTFGLDDDTVAGLRARLVAPA